VLSGDAVAASGQPVLASAGAPLTTLSDSALLRSLARPGARIPTAERAHVAPGMRVAVYMWVPVTGAPPRAIRHRLTAIADSGSSGPLVLETSAVPVTLDRLVITAPLKGSGWLAANGPSAESGHRRAMIPLSGS